MVDFLKLDLSDEDDPDPNPTIVEAADLQSLLSSEIEKYRGDGYENMFVFVSEDACSIKFDHGDGGQYTVAVYAPKTDEGRKKIDEWCEWSERGEW